MDYKKIDFYYNKFFIGKIIEFEKDFSNAINDRYKLAVKFEGENKKIYKFYVYGNRNAVENQIKLLFDRIIKGELEERNEIYKSLIEMLEGKND